MTNPDWAPAASLRVLRQRARLLAEVRRFFMDRGYWEVETPLLSRDTCVDTWIDPVAVPHPTRPDDVLYLQTSPEFAMKRLLAAGADAIFEITRSFRRGESGPRHNLEFTILEWYRAGDTHHEQMTLVEDLIRRIAATSLSDGDEPGDSRRATAANPVAGEGATPWELREPCPPPQLHLGTEPFRRYTYDEAAQTTLGITLLDKSTTELRDIARSSGITIPSSLPGDDRDGWLNLLLAERIEPWLAQFPACFLYDYPASQAALAKVRRGDCDVAERFELYLGGVELCNGYHELTDPDELASRMQRHNAARQANGADSLPTDSRLVIAMRQGLPDCSGVALGFDRLVMWRLGLKDLREVLAFPFDRA